MTTREGSGIFDQIFVSERMLEGGDEVHLDQYSRARVLCRAAKVMSHTRKLWDSVDDAKLRGDNHH